MSHRLLRIRRLLLGATSIAALGLATPAHAIDWTGATSSDWFSAGNWSTAVPTSGDTVYINTVTPNATVVSAAGAQVGFLGIGLSGTGTLSVQHGGTVSNGYLGVNAGSTGTVTVTGAGSSWTIFLLVPGRRQHECCEPAPFYCAWGCFRDFVSGLRVPPMRRRAGRLFEFDRCPDQVWA